MKQRLIFREFLRKSVFFTFKIKYDLLTFLSVNFAVFAVFCSFSVFSQNWQVFTLDDCIKTALEKSPVLKGAQEKTAESTAKVKETKTYFFPKLSASASITQLDEPPYLDMTAWYSAIAGVDSLIWYLGLKDLIATGDSTIHRWLAVQQESKAGSTKYTLGGDKIYNMSLTLVQPIFMGFKILKGNKAAQNALMAVKENEAKTRREVVLEVKKLFFTVLQTQQLVVVCDTAIRQLEEIVRDLENYKETGFVGEQEVMSAKVYLYNVQLMKIKAENGVVLLKSALCNSMGIDWNTPIVLNHTMVEPADIGVSDLTSLVEKAQKNQSEIKALEYHREALKNMVDFAKSNYYPAIYAMGNYSYKNPNRQYKDEFYTCWDITLGLRMNIFDWGETRHKVSQAKSQMYQLDYGLAQLKGGIALLVEKNYLAVVEAFKKIDLSKKAMETAQLGFNITHDKFQVGMAKNSDLLESQRLLTQAKIEFYNSVAAYYMARSELEYLFDN